MIEHEGKFYHDFQATGFASRFAFPFAKEICKGDGLDVGCSRMEWKLPGAWGIDLEFDDPYDAMNLPEGYFDYIFSSHCLEHLPDWVGVLDYWGTKTNTIFLYLPHYSQTYWRPWNNRKHLNILQPEYLKDYFEARGWKHVTVTGYDLNNAFYAVAER